MPPFTYSLSCKSRFLLVNFSKLSAGMLIKCCILPSRNIKSAKAFGAPAGGAHSAPPNPLAGFKPILSLVVFFIGLCEYCHPLTFKRRSTPIGQKWAPIRLGGPKKIWGPGIDLRTPWKIFSLRPCLCSSSSSSNLFQSQRSLKSQLKQKQSMLTIVFTGNREEAK